MKTEEGFLGELDVTKPSATLSAIELGAAPGVVNSIALYTLQMFKFVYLLHLNLLYKLQQNLAFAWRTLLESSGNSKWKKDH